MDRAILQAQLTELEAELALAAPGSVEQATLQAQVMTLENEIADEPVVPHIFGPHGAHGGVHGGHGR
jgi:hypothetical protein